MVLPLAVGTDQLAASRQWKVVGSKEVLPVREIPGAADPLRARPGVSVPARHARSLDRGVPGAGGSVLESEIARDQVVGIDRAHHREPGQRHGDEDDKRDEQHHAALRASRRVIRTGSSNSWMSSVASCDGEIIDYRRQGQPSRRQCERRWRRRLVTRVRCLQSADGRVDRSIVSERSDDERQ